MKTIKELLIESNTTGANKYADMINTWVDKNGAEKLAEVLPTVLKETFRQGIIKEFAEALNKY